jgi:catechol 2,3-dioxygenase-like lactoylglutathione lyase family enzyme
MLNDCEAVAMIAVKDLSMAAQFYESCLGLRRMGTQGDEAITYRSGASTLNVYRSAYAGSNKATAAVWNVGGDIESIVGHLKAKGVMFEHYDLPGLTLEGDIYRGGDMRVAWFKDPDGNILSLVAG